MEKAKLKQMDTSFPPFYDFFTLHPFTAENPMKPHWRKELEIDFVVSGEHELLIDGKEYHLKERDIAVINPNTSHSHINPPTGRITSLTISANFITANGFGPINGSFKTIISDEELWDKFKDFYFAYYTIEPLREVNLRIKILDILMLLYSRFYTPETKHTDNIRLNQVIEYLNANYTENITLEFLAREFHYNKTYLASAFKKAVGCTIIEYINQNRCSYADSLIKTTELKIGEIAEMCGFGTDANFRKVYKKYRSFSPTKVRERHKAEDMHVGKPVLKK